MDEDIKNKPDEGRKEPAPEEKISGGVSAYAEVSFNMFISGLAMESLVTMGDIENPITKKREVNLPHAKFIIDTLAILEQKTKGNLTPDEAAGLEAILYDLRMRFVAKTKDAK